MLIQELQNLIAQKQGLKATVEYLENPCVINIQYKSQKGVFEMYNRETQEKTEIGESIELLVVDQVATLKGWSQPHNAMMLSNMVRNSQEEPFSVFYFVKDASGNNTAKHVVTGFWKENIKGRFPVKYTASIYGIMKINKKYQAVNLQISGACLQDVIKSRINPADAILIKFAKNPTSKKIGLASWFPLAISKSAPIDENSVEEVMKIVVQIQDYLSQELNRTHKAEESTNNHKPSNVVPPDPVTASNVLSDEEIAKIISKTPF